MNGLILSKVFNDPIDDTRVVWTHTDDVPGAIDTLHKYQFLLTDAELIAENPQLHRILEYRGRSHGMRDYNGVILELYNVRTEEQMYLDMMSDVLRFGNFRTDRTGVGVYSTFGKTLRFGLRNNALPLLTTKRVYFKGVAKELLWFIKGSTNNRDLRKDNVHIWNGNASREFLDNRGLLWYNEGELGPIYGYQWRRWGEPYTPENGYKPAQGRWGIDQLQDIIDTIQNDPYNRRMILSAWNVSQLSEMALPPCHIMAQFYVHEKNNVKYLSCSMYQRSADVFLGVPFNIASYALLTHMIAQVTGTVAHELIILVPAHNPYQTTVRIQDSLRYAGSRWQ